MAGRNISFLPKSRKLSPPQGIHPVKNGSNLVRNTNYNRGAMDGNLIFGRVSKWGYHRSFNGERGFNTQNAFGVPYFGLFSIKPIWSCGTRSNLGQTWPNPSHSCILRWNHLSMDWFEGHPQDTPMIHRENRNFQWTLLNQPSESMIWCPNHYINWHVDIFCPQHLLHVNILQHSLATPFSRYAKPIPSYWLVDRYPYEMTYSYP